jgi:hypothetical protein
MLDAMKMQVQDINGLFRNLLDVCERENWKLDPWSIPVMAALKANLVDMQAAYEG